MHMKATYNLAIGIVLKELQNERRVDREKLATALEISDAEITLIENGEQRMTAGELIVMLTTLELAWEDFMQRLQNKMPEAEAKIR